MENITTIGEPNLGQRISWRIRPLFGDPIPGQALGFCFDQMAFLLRSGMSIPDAFQRAAHGSDPELSRIADAVYAEVVQGTRLTQALAPWSGRFPEIVLPVLEVGEVGGTMEGSCRRLADAFSLAAGIERKFKYGIYNPWYAILGLSLFHAATHLVPTVLIMLEGLLTTLLTLSGIYLIGRLVLRLLMRWQPLRMAVDTLKLALPHVGTVYRNLAAARWGRSFSTLWNSGVAISYALEVSSRSALNAHYERMLLLAARQTRQGRSLHDSLAGTQLLPGHLLNIIATGETTGKMGDALERFVTLLENEAYTRAAQEFMTIIGAIQIIGAVILAAGAMR